MPHHQGCWLTHLCHFLLGWLPLFEDFSRLTACLERGEGSKVMTKEEKGGPWRAADGQLNGALVPAWMD